MNKGLTAIIFKSELSSPRHGLRVKPAMIAIFHALPG